MADGTEVGLVGFLQSDIEDLTSLDASGAAWKPTTEEARLEYFQSARARSKRGLFGSFFDRRSSLLEISRSS